MKLAAFAPTLVNYDNICMADLKKEWFVKLFTNKTTEAQSAISTKKTGWSKNVLGMDKYINKTKSSATGS